MIFSIAHWILEINDQYDIYLVTDEPVEFEK